MADEITILPVIISLIAVVISFSSFIYSYLQNRRLINVNLFIEKDEDNKPVVHLMAYNPGYRSITLLRSKFLVND